MCSSLITPIIKPINGFCNLDCGYCYADDKEKVMKIMKDSVLKKTIDFFCSKQSNIEFIWHGGEPLLAGIKFYKRVIEYQKKWIKNGKKIINFIQTNGTVLNKDLLDFLSNNNFFVGVSLDGPKEINDQVRCFKNKKGSFDKIIKNISLLKEKNIFTGVICCVSSINYNQPIEIFDFFKSNNINSIKFSRVKEINNENDVSITAKQFTDFLIAIFERWIDVDSPEIEITNIKSIINIMFGGDFRECTNLGKCYNYCTVYRNGDIYGCDVLPKNNFFKFGTVFDSPEIIRNSEKVHKIKKIIKNNQEKCVKCRWFNLCKGGCLQCRFIETEEEANEYCFNLKRLYSKIYI
jgi:uncharacterized protein